MSNINLNRIKSQLRTLVAVADFSNFSEAALHLEIYQSAVSHAIAALKEELGVTLLAWGRHGANLTPAGEGVISYARQVLQLLEGMAEEANLKVYKVGKCGLLPFKVLQLTFCQKLLPNFLRIFPQLLSASSSVTILGMWNAL